MDDSNPEGITYANIRQTIRELIFPLVQAIYDENPSDMILFCSVYFNNLLRKRNNDTKDMSQITSCVGETNQLKENDTECQIDSKAIDNLPTYVQGSASAPILTAGKSPTNVRETSSWDTPANFTEPIKSLAVLEDVARGIGDQSTPEKSQLALENEAETGDISLKHDSAFEDDGFSEHKIMYKVKKDSTNEDYVKSTDSHNEDADETLKTLCTEFQHMKASEDSESLKHDNLGYDDSDKEIESTANINLCRKQLSPNSSFGFIPHIKEHDSEEEMKERDNEDLHEKKFKAQTRDIKVVTKNISESFSNLAAEINCSKTNFNAEISNEQEICDSIQGRNEASFSTLETLNRNTPVYIDPEVNLKEHEETKEDLTEPIDSHLEKFSNQEKSEATSLDGNDDDNDRSDNYESQVVVDKLWRKRWYEAHPSFGNFNRFQSRDPTLHWARFPNFRPKIGESGDFPIDRFYIPNGTSNINCRQRNPVTSETSTGIRDFSSRFSSDETNQRSNSARPFDNLTEKKTSSENISNANPQNIPYSWRKLCKQSRSSENVVNYSEESQANSNEDTHNSVNSTSNVLKSSLNEVENSSKTDVNGNEDVFFEASEKIEIEGSKEEKIKQCRENIRNISVKLIHGQRSNIHNAEQENTMDEYTNSKDRNHSSEQFCDQDGFSRDQSAFEKDMLAQNCKQSTTENGMETKAKDFIDNGLHAQKDKVVNQHNGHSMKGKFDLAAACGDFVSSLSDANRQDINSQSAATEREENNVTEPNNEKNEPISIEYFEEVIESVIEQQNNDSKESYEDLTYSSYSESESSYIELSDCSETEDFSMNESLQEK